MNRSVLVVAAHPDDEVLGCGATMAKLAAAGEQVHVFFASDGVTSRGTPPPDAVRKRQEAARKACAILGAVSVEFGTLPDNRLDEGPLINVIRPIEEQVAQHRPHTVLTHHGGDLNIDHRLVHQAVVTACRPQPGHCVDTILFFEVASSTEWQVHPGEPFVPNWFEDVGAFADRKMEALQAYAMELRPWPHPRSAQAVEAQLRWRGACAGFDAAEAFMLGRRRV